MYLVKCRFIKNEEPVGKEYTYQSKEVLKVGDMVQINESSKGIITVVDVAQSEVEAFQDKFKTIIGKVVNEVQQDRKKQERREEEHKFNLIRGAVVGLPLKQEEKQELIDFMCELEEGYKKGRNESWQKQH